jgi:anti-sigma factor RsiW
MNCAECGALLDAYCDGELDLVRHVELEAHLRGCPSCSRAHAAASARAAAVRALLPRRDAPAGLRERILASLGPADRGGRARRAPWAAWAIAASAAAALLVGYQWGGYSARSRAVLDEAFTEHARSLQEGHLLDVVSTDRHTVRPWFAGKLDFSPPVVDLADVGFPLAGGRLDAIDGRTAAALVFHRGLHSINVFVWPAGASAPPRGASRGGFSAAAWERGGLDFVAVSDIPAGELERFAGEFRKRSE